MQITVPVTMSADSTHSVNQLREGVWYLATYTGVKAYYCPVPSTGINAGRVLLRVGVQGSAGPVALVGINGTDLLMIHSVHTDSELIIRRPNTPPEKP